MNKFNLLISKKTIFTLLRIAFGLIFIFSGWLKITDPSNFLTALKSFNMLPESLLNTVSVLIPLIEIVLGITIIIGYQKKLSLEISFFMLVFFSIIIGIKFVEGANVSCGCFGSLSKDKIDALTLVRNLVLLIINLFLYVYYSFDKKLDFSKFLKSGKNVQTKAEPNKSDKKKIFGLELKSIVTSIFILALIIEIVVLANENSELKAKIDKYFGSKEILKPGEQMKPFLAQNINGDTVIVEYNRSKGKKLLFIFSTDCGACKRNYSNWNYIAQVAYQKSVSVLGISLTNIEKKEKDNMTKIFNYPIVVTTDPLFRTSNKLYSTPLTFLIDTSGKILKSWRGTLDSLQKTEVINSMQIAI